MFVMLWLIIHRGKVKEVNTNNLITGPTRCRDICRMYHVHNAFVLSKSRHAGIQLTWLLVILLIKS